VGAIWLIQERQGREVGKSRALVYRC
jgi:hypothetical protein